FRRVLSRSPIPDQRRHEAAQQAEAKGIFPETGPNVFSRAQVGTKKAVAHVQPTVVIFLGERLAPGFGCDELHSLVRGDGTGMDVPLQPPEDHGIAVDMALQRLDQAGEEVLFLAGLEDLLTHGAQGVEHVNVTPAGLHAATPHSLSRPTAWAA